MSKHKKTQSEKLLGCMSLDSYLETIKNLYRVECEVRLEELEIMSLTIIQDSIEKHLYESLVNGTIIADDPVVVVKGEKWKYLVIGNKRARARHDLGETHIKAYVLYPGYPQSERLENSLDQQSLRLSEYRHRRKRIDSIILE